MTKTKTKTKRLSQSEMLDLIIDEIEGWAYGNDSDCSMTYALRNGYRLHAANLWLGSGAASDEVLTKTAGLKISRRAEEREIKSIMENAVIYVCPDCNHHAFCDHDEGDSISCSSCGETALKDGA